jgi:hypothetical protein
MNLTYTAETPRDADLLRTRRTFLFAREQVAAQTKGYLADRRAHRWAAYREPGVTVSPGSTGR